MYFLGYDIGSSFVKASIIEGETGRLVAAATAPDKEMKIHAPKPGWAEQEPETWWSNVKLVTAKLFKQKNIRRENIKAIGISYQMHGLVIVDKNQKVLRPSIIWCDSRAGAIGDRAFQKIGIKKCLEHFLNSPGNFTASKLKWVMDNEPKVYERIHQFMLPGDYIAMKMSGEIQTTSGGLSEGVFWDYKKDDVAKILLRHYGIPDSLIPDLVSVFSLQSQITPSAAKELGLNPGTVIAYRAGDQPNNAFSLNCLNPGEVAATAGTSGVIYGVTDQPVYDEKSRVNAFVHVNHDENDHRYGILLCINGTGILNGWMKRFLNTGGKITYDKMNQLAQQAPVGSDGLLFYPFGNGAERVFENRNPGAALQNFHFNTHHPNHLLRAAQEGIVFALNYGLDIMKDMDIRPKVIRAGESNMFLSPVFRQALASLTGTAIELYNTDGAQGAARGAAVGYGFYRNYKEAFRNLNKIHTVEPDKHLSKIYRETYAHWLQGLNNILTKTNN